MLKIGLGYIQIDFIKQIVKKKEKKSACLEKFCFKSFLLYIELGK